PTGAVHPTLEAFVGPLVETGFEVGILPSRHRATSETLYIRRDGNCGYICVEDLYSDTGVIVCFQIAPSRLFGSGILVSAPWRDGDPRSEEHTSELQSRFDLVCRLLLEKKKRKL